MRALRVSTPPPPPSPPSRPNRARGDFPPGRGRRTVARLSQRVWSCAGRGGRCSSWGALDTHARRRRRRNTPPVHRNHTQTHRRRAPTGHKTPSSHIGLFLSRPLRAVPDGRVFVRFPRQYRRHRRRRRESPIAPGLSTMSEKQMVKDAEKQAPSAPKNQVSRRCRATVVRVRARVLRPHRRYPPIDIYRPSRARAPGSVCVDGADSVRKRSPFFHSAGSPTIRLSRNRSQKSIPSRPPLTYYCVFRFVAVRNHGCYYYYYRVSGYRRQRIRVITS